MGVPLVFIDWNTEPGEIDDGNPTSQAHHCGLVHADATLALERAVEPDFRLRRRGPLAHMGRWLGHVVDLSHVHVPFIHRLCGMAALRSRTPCSPRGSNAFGTADPQ